MELSHSSSPPSETAELYREILETCALVFWDKASTFSEKSYRASYLYQLKPILSIPLLKLYNRKTERKSPLQNEDFLTLLFNAFRWIGISTTPQEAGEVHAATCVILKMPHKIALS
jgi:hypothetical protein